jgi:MraZ protein
MGNVSQLQNIFAGQFHHAVDDKNRITIPSRWRRDDGEDFIILPEAQEQFLLVMSHEEFARVIAEADASIAPRERKVFLRHLHARAQHASTDKQGRLVLPEELCQLLELNGEVTLVGGRGRFEIWNTKKWRQAHKTEKATYQRVADEIGL